MPDFSPPTSWPEVEGTALLASDPFLEPYRSAIVHRARCVHEARCRWVPEGNWHEASLSQGHHFFGFHRGHREGESGWWYREWAPGADQLFLIGDFNEWNRRSHPCERDRHGAWHLFLPDHAGGDRLTHGGAVKIHVVRGSDYAMDRIPAYIRRVVQVPGGTDFQGQIWLPPQPYRWRHEAPSCVPGEGLRIYEAHVGMSSEAGEVASFSYFRRQVLPRIARLGYNAVQLMAVQEHPYYGSFGYHVSNLFAVSSRFGTPEELKRLIDDAHGLGLQVIMDLVHSHMVKNTAEGLAGFDGTDHQYFHPGARGHHVAWDSMCYDYRQPEVLRLLLSNVRYWLEEFRFDGFRFDGVTSMLYLDHGLGAHFDHYGKYFGEQVDEDAWVYLALANDLAHAIQPAVVTIAEDVSGMPGLARPVAEGGGGFDYRLAMGVPDLWIRLLKEQRDEEWNLGELYGALLNRRWQEKHIGYAESHDQAMVGDKTLAMWLMDRDLYDGMSVFSENLVIDRGIALHKMIRLVTFTLAGEGYLNFMGNEFGHPEWIDFPREGNGFSYHYARRQWSLVEADHLRYQHLNAFDAAMQQLDIVFHLLEDRLIECLAVHEANRQLVFRRGELVFAFNFHATFSYTDWSIPVPDAQDYRLVISTDEPLYGGQGRIDPATRFIWQPAPVHGRNQSIRLYLPARTAVVLAPIPAGE